MRRLLIIALLALVLAALVFSGIGTNSYVLIRIGESALQITLWLGIFCLLLIMLSIWFLARLARGLLMGGWHQKWQQRRFERLTDGAIADYTARNWSSAHKRLVQLANLHPRPTPYILMAAESAAGGGDIEGAREIYQQALDRFPENSFQIRLNMAQIELDAGNLDAAAELCQQLLSERKRDVDARLLELLIAEDRGELTELRSLLIEARTRRLGSNRLPGIERRFLCASLAQQPEAPVLLELAKLVSISATVPGEVCLDLCRQLSARDQGPEAEVLLREKINQRWDEKMVTLYADIEGKSARSQLKAAERWLKGREQDSLLRESLYRLAVRAGNEEKARRYQSPGAVN